VNPAAATADGTLGRYRHEAFLYSGPAEFLAGAMSFIRPAVQAGDPVLVMLAEPNLGLLRRELGAQADRVSLADMAGVGRNPGRIIAAWQSFVEAHPGAAQLRGITEPLYPGRSPDEITECQLHEALLNLAFEAAVPLWLLCPYDLPALAADVVGEVYRTHQFVAGGPHHAAAGSQPAAAGTVWPPAGIASLYSRPLTAVPAGADTLIFGPGQLRAVRQFAVGHARRAGLDEQATAAITVAVSEVATNSLQHGGGEGELRAWTDGRWLVCQVTDRGRFTAPLAGRLRPARGGPGGGLYLANQLCDLVQIRSTAEGTVVRVRQERVRERPD
jgi:anti-sigma regulatory factor (Ser/Thr protein kinase)